MPGSSTVIAGIDNLADRRNTICGKYMNKMKNTNHPSHALLPTDADQNFNYALRDKAEEVLMYQNFKFCRIQKRQKITFLIDFLLNNNYHI
jgi:hypothetical protein